MNICIYGASSAELEQIYYEKNRRTWQNDGKAGGMALCLAAERPE